MDQILITSNIKLYRDKSTIYNKIEFLDYLHENEYYAR